MQQDQGAIIAMVLVINIAFVVGSALIAIRKKRSAAFWGLLCFALSLIGLAWIGLIIIACAPKLKAPEPLPTFKVGHDPDEWERLVSSSPDIAASVEQLRPFGERWIRVLASYLLVSDDHRNLQAITQALLAQAKAAALPAVPGSELDRLGENIEALFHSPRGTIAALKNGKAIVEIDGRFEAFQSVKEYRRFHNDRARWDSVTDPGQLRIFVAAAREILEEHTSDWIGQWKRLVASDPNVAASFERLRPLGARYGTAFAAYVLSSGDRKNLAAITQALIDKAAADARLHPQGSAGSQRQSVADKQGGADIGAGARGSSALPPAKITASASSAAAVAKKPSTPPSHA